MELEQRTSTAAHWGRDQYEAIFMAGPHRILLLVEESHRPRGFLIARAVGPEWEVENVVIDEASRRRGLGMHLLTDFLAMARGEGAQTAFLEVRESNTAARALYERCAFLETGRRTAYFRNPEEDAILYRLSFL